MEKIILINLVIAIIFCICYSYQFLYVIVSLMKKDKPHQETKAPACFCGGAEHLRHQSLSEHRQELYR